MLAPPLIWFADDWGRHPSSSQHLARRILTHRAIWWVNTIGTRKPSLNLETLRRGIEKLRHWSRAKPSIELPENLHVSNPRMWPWFSHGWDRWLNRTLLARHLRRLIATMPGPPTIVTTLPLTADLVGRVPAARWVYYCVDDFSTWPGLDGRTLLDMERRLVENADCLIAVSETLRDRLRAMGRESELLTHGVDLSFWRGEPTAAPDRPSGAPRILFWGAIDRRMDLAIVRQLAAANLGSIVLVGPQNDPAPELRTLPGVEFMPAQPLDALPALARTVAVFVMPYADLPVTRAIQPLKLKEYLATGLPCVVRDLPANREWAECLDLADSPEAFVAAVKRRLVEGVPELQRLARQRLDSESWEEKARVFEQIIDG